MDHRPTRQRPHNLSGGEVVFVTRLQNPVDPKRRHLSGSIVSIAMAAARAIIRGDFARRIVGKRAGTLRHGNSCASRVARVSKGMRPRRAVRTAKGIA